MPWDRNRERKQPNPTHRKTRAAVLVHTGFIRQSQDTPEQPAPRWRKAPGTRTRVLKKLEKGRPGREIDSVGWTGFKGMIASGWQTAPLQAPPGAVKVTDSACQISSEASPSVSERIQNQQAIAPPGNTCTLHAPALSSLAGPSLHLSVHTASRSRTLSAPSVSGA
jgi:hypothetical protein